MSDNPSKQSAQPKGLSGPRRGPSGPMGIKQTAQTLKALDRATFSRLMQRILVYKKQFVLVLVCIVLSAVASVSSSLFLGRLIDHYITPMLSQDVPDYAPLVRALLIMACIYLVGITAGFLQNRIMAVIGQGVLKKIRDEMFAHMQTLPIRYFDTHSYGDIMSRYTNDTDTLRQLITQSIPQMLSSLMTVLSVFVSMLIQSLWLTLIMLLFLVLMTRVTGKIVGKSGTYFVAQQKSLGEMNAYIEEMINGQKVVKVFCHEEKTKEEFDLKNDHLFDVSSKANIYSSIMGPINNNFGYIIYAILAIIGGALAIGGVTNVSLRGINTLTVGAIASFLQLSRNFIMPIGQLSQQLNVIVMAMAGAGRIFQLLDEAPETDQGYVTLVNARRNGSGALEETKERTGLWAWKHPHQADGSVSYTELKGEVTFDHVDFGYTDEKLVLHDITLYARQGQKVALVGATGAGKTTITNLINRFYDIADGKVRYDEININKIRKADLRHSLGVILQDVNLFTGTVMDNIRYGKLDATDEECIAAAKLVNADSFINMLPDGYNTVLESDGANLSQGQRQLLSIARAAVADPPVMIMDEATSSIDTRTEAIVQKGMDALMQGRTVFVIAHRLSTVQNADVIMVLEDGRIIERGTHAQLIEKKGKYYQLYTGAFELE